MTCSKYGMRNHNSRGCGKYSNQGKHSKQAVEKDPVEENIKLIPPYQTQENQYILDFVYPCSSSIPNFWVDDEDPLLMVRTESEQAHLQRLQRRLKPQQPTESRVISFRDDRDGVSEPTNLPISPTGLTWKGKYAITTSV